MLHLPNKKRPNKNAKIPYAYKSAEEDPLLLVADEEILPFLQEALVHLDNGHSFRKTAEWLTAKTGSIISHQGIANIWKRHRDPKKNERLKQLAKQNREKRPKTKEERLEKELKKTVSTSKARITKAKKRLNQLNPVDDSITNQLDFSSAEKEDKEIIFKPNLGPQTEFLASSEREVLYGGSAGSGKTYCLLADPMRYFGNPNFNGLILRRTNDELREIVWK